ncbi:N-carbamoylputrescine amidase [Rubellimicrobium thermophilum DSM 16684]|uniref:N-carbamoylputrescine amidase n=1 Tax=Rubellimicrobium thermophilum DSM 16684 TaxID=1123069 RepID=S9S8X2_9RHOB|nr:N-carbamoylputrescine amidase [Rubellimicrobium thermophilum]EPX82714.1 N-carbamoylputrescine amidase [Rubellimicrobium thermophilum DSM 16684]
MRDITLAAVQFAMSDSPAVNADRAEGLVREAAAAGARLVLLPELFESRYFCITQDPRHLALARPFERNPLIARFADLARELGIVLPIPFFERANQAFFNAVAIADADGRVLGHYRKSHIPQNPGYEEKFYFSPGDTGFRVWDTAIGRIGVGICWDQWFPETARAMALMGAEILCYPSAIGSEPSEPGWDSQPHWETVMRGHAGANLMPLLASNRIGTESQDGRDVTFYGSSFVADATGQLLARGSRDREEVVLARLDLEACAALRAGWGLFRDRRVDLYGRIAAF